MSILQFESTTIQGKLQHKFDFLSERSLIGQGTTAEGRVDVP